MPHSHRQHIIIDLKEGHQAYSSLEIQKYVEQMFLVLSKLLAPSLLYSDHTTRNRLFKKELPLVQYTLEHHAPGCLVLSILALAPRYRDLGELLTHMLSYQLVPGKILYITSFRHCHFYFPDDNENRYYLAEAQLILRNEYEIEKVEELLPHFINSIKTSLINPRFVQHLLKRQNSWEDPFSANVQDLILRIIERGFARETDGFLDEMSGLLLFCHNSFKKSRTAEHFTRIVCSALRLRKAIEEEEHLSHAAHHLLFRLIPATLQYTFGKKQVLGVCIATNQFDDYEMFHQKHILSAIRFFLPETKMVHDSYFHYYRPGDSTHIHYLEIENKNAKPIYLNTLKEMRSFLQEKLCSSVERVTPTLFIRRNEEEIMKHILILNSEITTPNDLPQAMISFDSQSRTRLTFTVVLVRVLKKDSPPIQHVLADHQEREWSFSLEKTRMVNDTQECPKEASIFNLKIKKNAPFLRANSSINLYEARQQVVQYLAKRLGPIRDYMGGLIDCQQILSIQLKQSFYSFAQDFPDVLEDFFYSLTPMESQATLPFEALQTLFRNFLVLVKEGREKQDQYLIKKSLDQTFAYAMIRIPAHFPKEHIHSLIEALTSRQNTIHYTQFEHQGFFFLGLVQNIKVEEDKYAFFSMLEAILKERIRCEQKVQFFRLPLRAAPLSLDPRVSPDTSNYQTSKLLFEGLMRLDAKGMPQYAIAKKYTLSADRKTYTFTLRQCHWNDGTPITAHDFVYAWKKILSPAFPAPFVYPLYLIKNAKKAKMGDLSLDSVGIQAIDDRTLRVELVQPTSSFLELTTYSLFYPIKNQIYRHLPDWALRTHPEFVANGPFTLISSTPGKRYTLAKNPRYWDADNVKLDKITLTVTDGTTGLKMFKQGKLDWLGYPTSPWETTFSSCGIKPQTVNSPTFSWVACNIHSFPLSNRKLRQALSWAINRKAFIQHMPVSSVPLSTLFLKDHELENFQLPPIEGDPAYAQGLFKKALEEMQLDPNKSITLTLFHAEEKADIRQVFLLKMQQQLKAVLGLTLNVEALPWSQVSRKTIMGNYELCVLSWHHFLNTPHYLYEAFKFPQSNSYYKWENFQFRQTMDAANREEDPIKRKKIMNEAERILLEDVPIIPLFSETGGYVKNPRITDYQEDEAGFFDFKKAYFTSDQEDKNIINWL
ncbi:MAG: peptide ABC transporter substrate-binding protein [Waddliaceae bacterium]